MAHRVLIDPAMIGELVGNYEVLSRIGAGGMGAVYLARHRLIGRRVAIKVLLPGTSSNPEMVERFFNEARSTSAIKHAGLIDVFDFGWHNGSAYLAMEYLEGESLAARLAREGRLAPDVLAPIGRQVASAVGAAHAHGIVHRDLKPDNIFLVPDEEIAAGVRAKVLDFGIAKLSGEQRPSFKTRTGSLMGTPAYMSPEQCRGAGDVDHRSDIYSLGCILYEMALGRPPFIHEAIGPMMMSHMIEEPPLPRQLDPSLPEKLENVIRRAMAKDPADRFSTMEALSQALGGRTLDGAGRLVAPQVFAAGTISPSTLEAAATAMSVHPTASPPRSRRVRNAAIAIAAMAMVAAAIAAVVFGRGSQAKSQRSAAAGGDAAIAAPADPGGAAPIDDHADAASAAAAGADAASAAAAIDAAAPPARVTLTIRSEPPGADVFAVADGSRLGRTPLVIERDRSDGSLPVIVKLDGRKDARAEVSLDRDGAVDVALERKHHGGRGTPGTSSGSSSGSAGGSGAGSSTPGTGTSHGDTTIDPFAPPRKP